MLLADIEDGYGFVERNEKATKLIAWWKLKKMHIRRWSSYIGILLGGGLTRVNIDCTGMPCVLLNKKSFAIRRRKCGFCARGKDCREGSITEQPLLFSIWLAMPLAGHTGKGMIASGCEIEEEILAMVEGHSGKMFRYAKTPAPSSSNKLNQDLFPTSVHPVFS